MIKEAKDIDFYTTGKQPSEADFARITEWIKKNKAGRLTTASKKTTFLKSRMESTMLRNKS